MTEKQVSNRRKYIYLLAASFFTILMGIYIYDRLNSSIIVNVIKGSGTIAKMEMKISSSAGVKNVLITDTDQLDSINIALKEAKEIDAQKGGAFEVWASVFLYKKGHRINFFIQHSVYNGWMVEIGNKTYASNYLFHLVEFYNNK